MLKNILLLTNLLLLGACTTGMVASDVDLTLSNVSIKQSDQVEAGAQFSHQLREEILHQFAKTGNSANHNKQAFLSLEIQKLEYPGNQPGNSARKTSVLSGAGSLGDEQTGSNIGDFRISVSHRDERYAVSGLPGANFDQSGLIQMMARAILKKVYGSSRARKISENPSQYVRQPYRRKPKFAVTRNSASHSENDSISGLRLSLANGVLPADFIGPPTNDVDENKVPEVIEAPQLRVE